MARRRFGRRGGGRRRGYGRKMIRYGITRGGIRI